MNEAIRRGLSRPRRAAPFRTRAFKMGHEPAIPWDKALRLAADIEDEELVRRLSARK